MFQFILFSYLWYLRKSQIEEGVFNSFYVAKEFQGQTKFKKVIRYKWYISIFLKFLFYNIAIVLYRNPGH